MALTIARCVDYLRARGHRVQVFRPRQAHEEISSAQDCLVPGVPLPFYPGVQLGLPVVRHLRKLWRARKPQLVHIATEGPLGWAALHVARELGVPATSDYRTQFHRYSTHYGAGWLENLIDGYLRSFHNRADATFVCTDALREELAARGYRNLVTVGRGVDTALFSPARRDPALREAWGVAPDELAVLHVGRLAPEKNLELAARAYEAIRERHPGARMVWVGDGPARSRLQRAHPGHRYCGVVRGEALAAHYASADIFLFPSTTETFGNVTLEALASGLAVVAYDYGAAAQHARDGEHARLVRFGDARQFVEAAVEIATTPALRARLRCAAPEAVLPLEWRRVLAGFEAHLAARALPVAPDRRHAPQ
ncbi:MAG TPA: glycosyltransferase family 1 protein [Burkholderiales bacterium]|nr:glycosyltransferase family 1 protein [Burkholderiales bacterium]